MSITVRLVLILVITFLNEPSYSQQQQLTDQKIKQLIVQQSISQYSGNCPCPYNSASNGSRCGGRSAYSRAGGYTPLCYETDVTQEMVNQYKANH